MELKEILKAYEDYINNNPMSFSLPKDKVGIEPIFDSDTSPGGIIIPEMSKGRCAQGIVKAIGPDVENVSIGDYVLFSGYDGQLLAYGDEIMIILPEDYIAAKLIDSPVYSLSESDMTMNEIIAEIKSQTKPLFEVHNKLESRTKS